MTVLTAGVIFVLCAVAAVFSFRGAIWQKRQKRQKRRWLYVMAGIAASVLGGLAFLYAAAAWLLVSGID